MSFGEAPGVSSTIGGSTALSYNHCCRTHVPAAATAVSAALGAPVTGADYTRAARQPLLAPLTDSLDPEASLASISLSRGQKKLSPG